MLGLLGGARKAVKTCMGVKPGESVLVVTDPPRLKIARALIEASNEARAEATLICMPIGRKHGAEPPKVVASAMQAADVVLAPTTYSITHSQARLRACEAGARVATMPMITERMMRGGAMLADYQRVKKLTMKIAARLDNASEVELTSPAGTELRFDLKGRRACPDTGIIHMPGEFGNLPAGEAFIAPLEGTAKGRAVVDGLIADVLRGRTEITFEGGRATDITGEGAQKLRRMLEGAGPDAYILAEFGIGTNPAAKLIGNVLEDEKVLGTCHIALGDNSTFGGENRVGIHLDGILLLPTIKLNGEVIMKNGKFKS